MTGQYRTGQYWRNLAILSVRKPGDAARVLMALGLGTGVLWNALVLIAIANAVQFSLSNMILPGPSPLPGILGAPLVYFAIVAGGLSLTALSIYWTGRFMGGEGTLADVLVLIVWMQILRLLVQVAALVLVLVMPILSILLVIIAGLIGVYMLVNFINQAHRFNSIAKATVVLVLSILAIVAGLSLLLTIFVGPYSGATLNV